MTSGVEPAAAPLPSELISGRRPKASSLVALDWLQAVPTLPGPVSATPRTREFVAPAPTVLAGQLTSTLSDNGISTSAAASARVPALSLQSFKISAEPS